MLIFVNKGIEIGSNKLPLEVIQETCGAEAARVSTFLVSNRSETSPINPELILPLSRSQSGPSFAKEIVKRQPTQVSVASTSQSHAQAVATLFHQPHFRC